MITCRVYCVVCVLFVVCRGQDLLDIEGYSNDYPFNAEPKIDTLRVKAGTPIFLKCTNHRTEHLVWEYKECGISYKGIACNLHDLTNTKSKDPWRIRSTTSRFRVDTSNKTNSGLYRCIDNGVLKKSTIIEIVGVDSYDGPPPIVQSLLTSNITNQLNMKFTIQCNISSIIPPTVIWFKKCFGSKCDIKYDDICYCHLNIETSSYSIGGTYISKINIINAREIDSGLYACLAVTEYGKDYKSVTITVPDGDVNRTSSKAFSLLFLVPLALVVVPVLVWLCYFRKKKKRKSVVAVVAEAQQRGLLSKSSASGSGVRTTTARELVTV